MLLCFEGTGMRKGRWYPQTTYMTLQKKSTCTNPTWPNWMQLPWLKPCIHYTNLWHFLVKPFANSSNFMRVNSKEYIYNGENASPGWFSLRVLLLEKFMVFNHWKWRLLPKTTITYIHWFIHYQKNYQLKIKQLEN